MTSALCNRIDFDEHVFNYEYFEKLSLSYADFHRMRDSNPNVLIRKWINFHIFLMEMDGFFLQKLNIYSISTFLKCHILDHQQPKLKFISIE